jgi:acetoacetate decarboxylase
MSRWVKYEFIRMADSAGFGNHAESGQVIPLHGPDGHGGYLHAMFLDDDPPLAGGRELRAFPKACPAFAAGRARHSGRHARLQADTARDGGPWFSLPEATPVSGLIA